MNVQATQEYVFDDALMLIYNRNYVLIVVDYHLVVLERTDTKKRKTIIRYLQFEKKRTQID